MIFEGELVHIHVSDAGSEPMRELRQARLLAGVGIEGDRYATGRGYYSDRPDIREITLIEEETLIAIKRDHDIDLLPQEHRRNLTTRNVPLNHLVGRRFRVGETLLEGGRLNVPCKYLQELLDKKVFVPLLNRSGLNCRIIEGGRIAPGDPIRPQ